MTATQTSNTPACQVGDFVVVHRRGTAAPGRIWSIHSTDDGVGYVVRTEPADDMSRRINLWNTSGRSAFRISMPASDETR